MKKRFASLPPFDREGQSLVGFNPEKLESVTLKELKGVELSFTDDGKPVTLIVKNPHLLGLNSDPEQPVSSQADENRCPWEGSK